jgi:plastocyanin
MRHLVFPRFGALAGAVVLSLGGILAGCSSGGTATNAEQCPATVSATIHALATIRFSDSQLNVKAGDVVVKLINDSEISHTFQVHGGGAGKAQVSSGTREACATFHLTAGTYTYYCGIPGHEANMHGKLIVGS